MRHARVISPHPKGRAAGLPPIDHPVRRPPAMSSRTTTMRALVISVLAAASLALSTGGAFAAHNFRDHDEAFDFFLQQQGQWPANRVYRSGPPAYDEDYYYWTPPGQDRGYVPNRPQSYDRDVDNPPPRRRGSWWLW